MNIQKIFNSLREDDMNSGLGIIVHQLELQGYIVNINDIPVDSQKIFNGELEKLEKYPSPLTFQIQDNLDYQKFVIEFIDYHKVVFRESNKNNLGQYENVTYN